MKLLTQINTPVSFFIDKQLTLRHPSVKELQKIIRELLKEDLDLRRLISVKNDSYKTKGKDWLEAEWHKSIGLFDETHPDLPKIRYQIINQKHEVFGYQDIPKQEIYITDPFNLSPIETNRNIDDLRNDQIQNSIIVKKGIETIAFGRLLEVEGSVEIVSIWTKPQWRNKGIAGKIISELLLRSLVTPIFSFQTLNLVPYYLSQYNKFFTSVICPFADLPPALQRDLFRMNIFWGPNVIIRIG